MSSKQINFYMVPEDISAISDFMKEKGCIFLKNKMEDTKELIDYDIVSNTENIFQIYLCNQDFKERLVFQYLDQKNQYYIDILRSYAIEFSLGGYYPFSNKVLHRSRLYFVLDYFGENDSLIKKNEAFINWADELINSFKTKFLKKSSDFPKLLLTENCLRWTHLNNPILTSGGEKFIIT